MSFHNFDILIFIQEQLYRDCRQIFQTVIISIFKILSYILEVALRHLHHRDFKLNVHFMY